MVVTIITVGAQILFFAERLFPVKGVRKTLPERKGNYINVCKRNSYKLSG